MTRVLLIAHHERPEARALLLEAVGWLHERGHDAWVTPEDADALGLDDMVAEHAPADADVVVSLGGDGTMLRAVHLLDGAPVPIIGVNVGVLGYLAEIEPHGLIEAIGRFVAGPAADRGDWEIEQRMMVDIFVHARGEVAPQRWRALNEGVLEKQEPGHTVRMLVRIDGASFTSYAADGLIVATPTGSTAYSLSARGPVVSPRHRALLLTPVSPHMLFDRSLVLDPEESIEIEVAGHRPVVLSIDGRRAASLAEGDVVRFEASDVTARFVRFGRHRFHQILKTKFGLSDR